MAGPSDGSSNLVKYIGEEYGFMGACSLEVLETQVEPAFQGYMYLCTDSGDVGVESGGFQDASEVFKFSRGAHVPFDPQALAFSVPKVTADEVEVNEIWLAAVRQYADFEKALDALPRPVVIQCKSGRRASCVLDTYKAVKSGTPFKTMIDNSVMQWHGSANMRQWSETVINAFQLKALPPASERSLILRQLFEHESSTFTYLLAEQNSKEAILIDPVLETVARDQALVERLGLKLKYVINTHVHADHITGTGKLKQIFAGDEIGEGAAKSAIASVSQAACDVPLAHGDSLTFGDRKLIAVSTPGHTDGCMTFILDDLSACFTGDALLIGGCGRTDFQQGSSNTLYGSVQKQILSLPDSTLVYPAHDYKGETSSTVGVERASNPRLGGGKTLEEFRSIMANLDLPKPKKLDVSLPANMACGV